MRNIYLLRNEMKKNDLELERMRQDFSLIEVTEKIDKIFSEYEEEFNKIYLTSQYDTESSYDEFLEMTREMILNKEISFADIF